MTEPSPPRRRRQRSVSVAFVLLFVALVPLAGVAAVTVSDIADAGETARRVERAEHAAIRLVELKELDIAVFDEQLWSGMAKLSSVFGLALDEVALLIGENPAARLDEARERTDELLRNEDWAVVAADLAALRALDAEFRELVAGFGQIRSDIAQEVDAISDRLRQGSGGGGERLDEAIEPLADAIVVRTAIVESFIAYFASTFDIRDEPAVEIRRLIALGSSLDAALAELADAAVRIPAISPAVDAVADGPELVVFERAIDQLITESLAIGVPTVGSDVDVVPIFLRVERFLTLYGAARDVDPSAAELIDAASTNVVEAAADLRAASSADVQRAYWRAGLLLALTLVAGALAAVFVVRPLRGLARRAAALQSGEPVLDSQPAGPTEVLQAAAAIDGSSRHFARITRQVEALSRGDLDADVLRDTSPGELGHAVQEAVSQLRSALTRQDEFRRRLAYEATHDGLTTLPNRSASLAKVTRALQHAAEAGSLVGVLFVDLDRFKDVNDHHGHHVGDQVLRVVAQRLAALAPGRDDVGRLGGDEFIVVADAIDDANGAVALGERIVSALSAPIESSGGPLTVGASVGVAISDGRDVTADDLLRDADLAVYQVKQTGRSGVRLCDDELRDEMLHHADLAVALRRAIDNDEFVLHYQPIFQAGSLELITLETLIRWERPGRDGLVPPGAFIPFAERSRMIVDIDCWVIAAVARQIAAWRADDRFEGVAVAINLSGRHLVHDDTVRHVLGPLADHGVDPSDVVIEVTESALLGDFGDAAAKLERLRAAGVRVSIDDFGTGYTSLAHLRSLPLDILKIDRSFVTDAARNDHQASIVKLIIDTGHLLGATVTSEGIETHSEVTTLTELGSDHLQGNLLASPLPPERLGRACQSGRVSPSIDTPPVLSNPHTN